MLGLRTKENLEFINFFKLVQEEAKKQDAVFFLDYGCGDVLTIGNIEYEDGVGWLIPNGVAKDFEQQFLNYSIGSEWDKFEAWLDWKQTSDRVSITIEMLDQTKGDL